MSKVRRGDIINEDVGQRYISRPRMCYTYRHISTQDVLLRYPATQSAAWSCFNYPELTSGNGTELSNTLFTFSKHELFGTPKLKQFWRCYFQNMFFSFETNI